MTESDAYDCGFCTHFKESNIGGSRSFSRPCDDCVLPHLVAAGESLVESLGSGVGR